MESGVEGRGASFSMSDLVVQGNGLSQACNRLCRLRLRSAPAIRDQKSKHACLFLIPLPCSPHGRPDARDRRPACRERGTRPARRRVEPGAVGARHPRPRLDRRPPDRPPRLDRPLRRCSPSPTRTPSRREVEKALTPPGRLRRRAAPRRGPRCRPTSCSRAGGPGATALDGRPCARRPPGARFPWYGPPMSRRLHGHRPPDGDLGPRPGHRRRARRAPRPPTDRLRHVARIGVRARDFAFGVHGLDPARRGVPRRTRRARRRRVDVRPRGRRPTASPAPRSTSASWSPSAPTAPTSPLRADGPDADRWLDIAQAFAGPPGTGRAHREGGRRVTASSAHRQRLRLLRRPLRRHARDAHRRRARRPHRRLPRRADHAHPRPRPPEGPRPPATPRRSCASWRSASASRTSAACGSSPTPAGSTRPDSPTPSGSWPTGSASPSASPTSRATTSTARAPRQPSPPTPTSAASASPPACGRAPTSSSPAGSPTRRWSPGPPPPTSAGARTTTTRSPAPSSPGTSWSAAPRPPAATTPSSPSSPTVRRPGFPIAEIHADGSAVITKHPGTGGAVDVGTVTAQLLYEMDGARYAGPDVTARLDTITLAQDGPDRVRITGVRGEAPPPTLKVGLNRLGGFRNEVTFVLTGLDIEAKAALVRDQLEAALAAPGPAAGALGPGPHRPPRRPPPRRPPAPCSALVVRDPDPNAVGRAFSGAAVELALAQLPRLPRHRPTRRGRALRRLHGRLRRPRAPSRTRPSCHDGAPGPRPAGRRHRSYSRPVDRSRALPGAPAAPGPDPPRARSASSPGPAAATRAATPTSASGRARTTPGGGWPTTLTDRPLPRAAPGDRRAARHPARPARTCAPSTSSSRASSARASPRRHRFDPQAKALGEWLRSRHVDIPEALL